MANAEVFKNGKPLIETMKSQLEQMIAIMNAIYKSSYIFPERILIFRNSSATFGKMKTTSHKSLIRRYHELPFLHMYLVHL